MADLNIYHKLVEVWKSHITSHCGNDYYRGYFGFLFFEIIEINNLIRIFNNNISYKFVHFLTSFLVNG